MNILIFIFLIFNFLKVKTEDAAYGDATAVATTQAPTAVQTVEINNNALATVTPSTPAQPNLEVSSPNISPAANTLDSSKTTDPIKPVENIVTSTQDTQTATLKDSQFVNQTENNSVQASSSDILTGVQSSASTNGTPLNDTALSLTNDTSQLTKPTSSESISNQSVDVIQSSQLYQVEPNPTQPEASINQSGVVSASVPLQVNNTSTGNAASNDTYKQLAPNISEKPAAKKERQEIMSSINTLDVEEEGNWLLKRVWWEQAEQTFEKIISLNDDVIKLQIDYISKRSELDKKLGDLFRKLGFDQGEISEILEYFLNHLSKQREAEGLVPDERDLVDILNLKKDEIEKLKSDLNSLGDLETTIDDVINQLVDQVNKSREYEKNAWKDFKEIGRVLNDKKAKTLFYQIEADLKNIQNIKTYLSEDLKKYYQDLLNNVDKTSNLIVVKINDLEKESGTLKEKFEKLQQQDEIRKQSEFENKLKKESQDKQRKPKKEKSWFGNIWDKVTSIF